MHWQPFTTTYKAGTAVLTAAATGYVAATQTITATGYTASKLAVYCAPSSLPSDNGVYPTVQVQLQDTTGRPAKAPSDLTVSLFSSQPSVAVVGPNVKIAMGQTCTTGALTVTKTAGQATVTAQASSYVTAQTAIANQQNRPHTLNSNSYSAAGWCLLWQHDSDNRLCVL